MILIHLLIGIIKKQKTRNNMKDKLIEKIEQICEEHLDNTEIDSVDKCEDYHDHYLLAKVDMAKEILETIIINKRK